MEGSTKTCTKCGIEKPLTEDFFFKRAVASFWRLLGRVEKAVERLDLFVKYLERTENGIAEIYG